MLRMTIFTADALILLLEKGDTEEAKHGLTLIREGIKAGMVLALGENTRKMTDEETEAAMKKVEQEPDTPGFRVNSVGRC
jgi:hypothetical protein